MVRATRISILSLGRESFPDDFQRLPTLEKLSICVFVQIVEPPAFAAMLTMLSRGLNDKVEKSHELVL